MANEKRKGASKVSDVEPEILKQLEAGEIETAALSEGLAVNFANLLGNVFPDLAAAAKTQIDPKLGITKRMAIASEVIRQSQGQTALKTLITHPSDTVRGWASYFIAGTHELSLSQKLERIAQLVDDPHFGVREWAWLAVRPDIAREPIEAIEILTPWATHPSEFIRRFTSEAIRPRGVWSPHIGILKSNPEHAVPVLDPLKSDPSRYVQDSVANWLNDAYKSQPDWVEQLCDEWKVQSASKETAYIVKRGLRSKQAR